MLLSNINMNIESYYPKTIYFVTYVSNFMQKKMSFRRSEATEKSL